MTRSAQGPKPAVDFQFDVHSLTGLKEPKKTKPNRQLKHQADVNVTGKQTEEVAADAW